MHSLSRIATAALLFAPAIAWFTGLTCDIDPDFESKARQAVHEAINIAAYAAWRIEQPLPPITVPSGDSSADLVTELLGPDFSLATSRFKSKPGP